MPDEFDEIYGHPELLPDELKGLREIRCDQCGHEMQILEQYGNASVACVLDAGKQSLSMELA